MPHAPDVAQMAVLEQGRGGAKAMTAAATATAAAGAMRRRSRRLRRRCASSKRKERRQQHQVGTAQAQEKVAAGATRQASLGVADAGRDYGC